MIEVTPPIPQLVALAIQAIMRALPTATGHMRAQHLGIYAAILALHGTGQPPSTSDIAKMLGMAATHVTRITRVLVEAGLVTREIVNASHGRGHLNVYHPVYKLSEIVAANPKASGVKKRPK